MEAVCATIGQMEAGHQVEGNCCIYFNFDLWRLRLVLSDYTVM